MASSSPVVIVTGASRGIGRACAVRLTQLGARLVLNGVSEANLKRLSDELGGDPSSRVCVAGDVSDVEVCKRLVDAAVSRFGRIDAVVNNAGVLGDVKRIVDTNPMEFSRTLEVNVRGPFVLTQLAIPELRKTRGRIVNVSSGAATHAYAGWSSYCASKAALNMLTMCVATEEPDVIAVALRPGVVETDMQADVRSKGPGAMDAGVLTFMKTAHEEGKLLSPFVPAEVIARMSVDAELAKEWSGKYFSYDDAAVKEYLAKFA